MLQNRHIFASVLTGSAVFMWGKILLNWGKNKPRGVSDPETYCVSDPRNQGYVYAGKKKQIIMKQFWYSIIFNHPYNLSASTPLWLLPQMVILMYPIWSGVNLELVLTILTIHPAKNIVNSQHMKIIYNVTLEWYFYFSSLTKLREMGGINGM